MTYMCAFIGDILLFHTYSLSSQLYCKLFEYGAMTVTLTHHFVAGPPSYHEYSKIAVSVNPIAYLLSK